MRIGSWLAAGFVGVWGLSYLSNKVGEEGKKVYEAAKEKFARTYDGVVRTKQELVYHARTWFADNVLIHLEPWPTADKEEMSKLFARTVADDLQRDMDRQQTGAWNRGLASTRASFTCTKAYMLEHRSGWDQTGVKYTVVPVGDGALIKVVFG